MGDISRWVINRLNNLMLHKDSRPIFLRWINDNVITKPGHGEGGDLVWMYEIKEESK